MLQLRLLLLLLLCTTSRNPNLNHASVSSPIPTRILIVNTSLKPTFTLVHIPRVAITSRLCSDLMPASPPHSVAHTHHGIPPHPFPLAGSCHQLHRPKKPTFINELLHVALSWKYQFREHFNLHIYFQTFVDSIMQFPFMHQRKTSNMLIL